MIMHLFKYTYILRITAYIKIGIFLNNHSMPKFSEEILLPQTWSFIMINVEVDARCIASFFSPLELEKNIVSSANV